MSIRLKRAYDPPARNDGYRVLVDRIWPRGIKKEEAQINDWMKEIAPSSDLRKWFGHDPEKWEIFKEKYFKELHNHQDKVNQLKEKEEEGRITLVFSAKDKEHNNAVALKEYLQHHA